jgi:hypothetical protein
MEPVALRQEEKPALWLLAWCASRDLPPKVPIPPRP